MSRPESLGGQITILRIVRRVVISVYDALARFADSQGTRLPELDTRYKGGTFGVEYLAACSWVKSVSIHRSNQSTRLTTVVFPAKRCKWIAAVETVPCVLVSHPVLLVKYLTLDLRKDGQ